MAHRVTVISTSYRRRSLIATRETWQAILDGDDSRLFERDRTVIRMSMAKADPVRRLVTVPDVDEKLAERVIEVATDA